MGSWNEMRPDREMRNDLELAQYQTWLEERPQASGIHVQDSTIRPEKASCANTDIRPCACQSRRPSEAIARLTQTPFSQKNVHVAGCVLHTLDLLSADRVS